jgi:hypothetical protein
MIFNFRPMIPTTTRKPIDNEDAILVEPCPEGGWQLRFAGDPQEKAIGHFATAAIAAACAKANCRNVRIIEPATAPAGTPAMPTLSPGARFAAACNQSINAIKHT